MRPILALAALLLAACTVETEPAALPASGEPSARSLPDTTEADEDALAKADVDVIVGPGEAVLVDPVFGGFDEFGARAAFEPDTLTLEFYTTFRMGEPATSEVATLTKTPMISGVPDRDTRLTTAVTIWPGRKRPSRDG